LSLENPFFLCHDHERASMPGETLSFNTNVLPSEALFQLLQRRKSMA